MTKGAYVPEAVHQYLSDMGKRARGIPKRVTPLVVERNRIAGRKSAQKRHQLAQLLRAERGLAPLPPLGARQRKVRAPRRKAIPKGVPPQEKKLLVRASHPDPVQEPSRGDSQVVRQGSAKPLIEGSIPSPRSIDSQPITD